MALGSDTLSAGLFDNAGLGNNQIIAAVPGARIQVIGYIVVNSVATAQAFRWRSGAGNNLTGQMALPSSVGGSLAISAPQGAVVFSTNINEALNIALASATAVAGHVFYRLHFA